VSPVYCKNFESIRTKLMEEIHFEVCLCLSVCPIANLKGPYFQPSLSVSLSVCVCVTLTGTSTLQRRPILMKLGHKDPTLI